MRKLFVPQTFILQEYIECPLYATCAAGLQQGISNAGVVQSIVLNDYMANAFFQS